MSSLPEGGRHRKAQAPPLSRMARGQTRDSKGFQKAGAKSKNLKEGVEVAKRVLSHILLVRANGTGTISV